MKATNIEVKAKYDSGKVYFTDMPNLKEESFEFIAKIPVKCVEKKDDNTPKSAQELLERIRNILGEHYRPHLSATVEQDKEALIKSLEEKYL